MPARPSFPRTSPLEAEAAGDSVGPRLRQEAREHLVRGGESRRAECGDVRAAVRALERRVERDLLIVLVEQVLREYDHLTPEDVQACLAYASDVLKSERVYLLPSA